jgi:hypothetical protein
MIQIRMNWWCLAGLAVNLCACGGGIQGNRSDAGTADVTVSETGLDAPGHDASEDIALDVPDALGFWSPVCPRVSDLGAACLVEGGTQCEYALDAGIPSENAACNLVLVCFTPPTTPHMWVPVDASLGECTTANPGTCPASLSAIPANQPCSGNVTCIYSDGTCECLPSLEVEAGAGEGGSGDAGAWLWACSPPPGCPAFRPWIGSACASEGQSCTYLACQYEEVCSGGLWQERSMTCGTSNADP